MSAYLPVRGDADMAFLSGLGRFLWGGPLPAAFLVVGLWYTFGSGFFQIFGLPVWLKTTVGSLFRKREKKQGAGAVSQFQALTAALGATVGTGSIAGVAAAIFYGGPGTVLWMWISAFFGMMTGCAEKILAVRHREKGEDGKWRGGPMQYMEKGLRLTWLAKFFAAVCVAESLVGGGLAQANSIAAALHETAGSSKLLVGVITAAVASAVLAGGIRRVGRLSELLTPAMALLFVGSGTLVIASHWQAVPGAFRMIFTYAFDVRAAAGGYGMWLALRYGVARGVFTNEAGLGMSAIAHACADVEEPAEQGMWGIFEVFFATLVVCTVTALVILTSGVYDPAAAVEMIRSGAVPPELVGAPLTAAGFATLFGQTGEWLVSVCLVLFAFTSIIGAGYYGKRGLETLTSSRWAMAAYHLLFPACIVLGAVGSVSAVWELVDVFNGFLAIPNLPALLLLSPEALHLLTDWLERQKLSRIAAKAQKEGVRT